MGENFSSAAQGPQSFVSGRVRQGVQSHDSKAKSNVDSNTLNSNFADKSFAPLRHAGATDSGMPPSHDGSKSKDRVIENL